MKNETTAKPHLAHCPGMTRKMNTLNTVCLQLILASLLILFCQGYEHLDRTYAFFFLEIPYIFLVHRLSFLSCKVQIILWFKSRLHIQYYSTWFLLHYPFVYLHYSVIS